MKIQDEYIDKAIADMTAYIESINIDWEALAKQARKKIEQEKTQEEREQEQIYRTLYGIFNGNFKIKNNTARISVSG